MAEQWRPVAASLLLFRSVGVAALPRFFGRAGMAMLLAGLTGFGVLMAGGVAGLAPVPSDLWGGLPLTLFLAVIACLAGVPLGILLALGRRSSLPLMHPVHGLHRGRARRTPDHAAVLRGLRAAHAGARAMAGGPPGPHRRLPGGPPRRPSFPGGLRRGAGRAPRAGPGGPRPRGFPRGR